jgi:hypothetical protein
MTKKQKPQAVPVPPVEKLTPEELEIKIETVTQTIDEYIERLDIGAAKIEEARSQGKDVTLWEDY